MKIFSSPSLYKKYLTENFHNLSFHTLPCDFPHNILKSFAAELKVSQVKLYFLHLRSFQAYSRFVRSPNRSFIRLELEILMKVFRKCLRDSLNCLYNVRLEHSQWILIWALYRRVKRD